MRHERERERARDRMLAAYGAKLWRWPEGRLDGLIGLAVQADFRQRYKAERTLDAALAQAEQGLPDDDRLERRLLAAMGVGELRLADVPRGFNLANFAMLATASLCFGLLIGGFYGGGTLIESEYAGLADSVWSTIAEDSLLGEAS